MIHDLRVLLRLAKGRHEQPTADIVDNRPLQSLPERGQRAKNDDAKRKKESKTHIFLAFALLMLKNTVGNHCDQNVIQLLPLAC